MTATAEPPAAPAAVLTQAPLSLGEGVELLGPVHGCGYRDGANLVRRGDGQMVQLGPLMYGLLECVDGQRDGSELAEALSDQLGRRVDEKPVIRLAEKLSEQGLLAGTEHKAPPRRNPLLALRFKVLVTNPAITRRLTAPFTFLFRPWIMWPLLAAFIGVFWFVLIDKGVASATAQAFHRPGLLLLVFALAVASAGFHELGHAAACRYGGATPGGMGMGLYLVWPAFYTDVTDTYRLPKRDRLRVDLAGLYFNVVVAVLTLAVWLVVGADALLLLVALQILQMVKQLSPVIRADGYHILSDWTGVPDLFSQMGPTLRRLLPGRAKEPSALSGKARFIVTLWVLIVVPVLLSMMLGAILLLPRVATSAWNGGHLIAAAIPHQISDGQILDLLASVVRLLALCLPLLGSVLVTQKIVRGMVAKGRAWSRGSRGRSSLLLAGSAALVALMIWAWWPSGQYQPVRANQNGTLGGLVTLVSSPTRVARPAPAGPAPARIALAAGKHLAVAMIPVGGATKRHPALFFISGGHGRPPVAVLSPSSPDPGRAGVATFTSPPPGSGSTTSTASPSASTTPTSAPGGASSPAPPVAATAFQFKLPPAPRPGDSQAVAVGSKDGGVSYDVAYSVVTVSNGSPVTERNSAYALASCNQCTTVAVSFQIVLIVGHTKVIAPINEAEALNAHCPACMTTAIADQIVVTLAALPTKALVTALNADLKQLNDLSALGTGGTPAAVAAEVAQVQQEIDTQLKQSGLLTNSSTASGAANQSTTASATSTSTVTTSSTSTTSAAAAAQSSSTAAASSPTPPTSPTGTPATTESSTTSASASTSSTTTSPATATTGTTASPAGG
jgi:putative peptide zinc metalloprotease protein